MARMKEFSIWKSGGDVWRILPSGKHKVTAMELKVVKERTGLLIFARLVGTPLLSKHFSKMASFQHDCPARETLI